MPLEAGGNAPYAPAPAVLDVIKRYRDRGLTIPFTTDILIRAGVTDSLAPRTLQALRLLELVNDDGQPTEALDALAKAPTESEYQERFASLIRGVYAEVFAFVDPAEEGQERIRGAFRGFTPRGQQERMVRLFLGLAAHAGIIPESAARVASTETATRRDPVRRETRPRPAVRRAKVTVTGAPDGLPPVLAGLLNELVTIGQSWNAEQHDRWLTAFQSMVDYSYPVRSVSEVPDEDTLED
jgi:hypothetical protein